MNPEELRIGNFVQEVDSKTKRPGMVWQHTLDKIILRMEHSTLELKANKRVNAYTLIEPVPLNEEKLEKFGFVKKEPAFNNSVNPYWVKDAIVLLFVEGQEELGYLPGIGHRYSAQLLFAAAPSNKWIKTVHELQNIYHSLNDKELQYEYTRT